MTTRYSSTLLGDPTPVFFELLSDAVVDAVTPNGRASGTILLARGSRAATGQAITINADEPVVRYNAYPLVAGASFLDSRPLTSTEVI